MQKEVFRRLYNTGRIDRLYHSNYVEIYVLLLVILVLLDDESCIH